MKHELRRVTLFEDVSDCVLRELHGLCQWREFAAGQEILGHHEESNDVFFLTDGTARAVVHSVSGKAVAFRDMKAGDIFGELAAIDDRPRAASVTALTSCRVASMTPDRFRDTMMLHPQVGEAVLRHLVVQIRSLSERVFEFSTLPVKHRIQAELLRLAQHGAVADSEAQIEPVPTHEEIANRVSTHRQAVTSEINRLVQSGLVERDGKRLRIKDMDRLTQMVQEATGN